MCFASMLVYPKPLLSLCMSMFKHNTLINWAEIAYNNGYLFNYTKGINNWEYYINMNGSLDHYNNLDDEWAK